MSPFMRGPADSALAARSGAVRAKESPHMSFPAFAALDREWRSFAAAPATATALARWQAAAPALAGFATVDEVVAARRDPDRSSGVFTALVALAHTDCAAARVLLQAVLPGLVRLSVDLSGTRQPDIAEHVLAIAWERIRSYGAGKRTAFVPNLLLDVRKALLAEWNAQPPPADLMTADNARPAEDEALSRLFLEEIAAMERTGTLQPGTTELLVLTRVEGCTLVEVAGRKGNVTDHGLLLRRRRAEARLRRELTAA
jgi:hypothetical protein